MVLRWTYGEIAEACGGELVGDYFPPSLRPRGISTDSRRLKKGELFIALRGERYDGHQFLPEVVEKGASGVIVSRIPTRLQEEITSGEIAVIRVKDTLKALQELSGKYRQRGRARVIGITGSYGKTLTKDFLASVLGERFRVVASEKSYNNEVGVPLTLLQIDEKTDFVVLEMGSRGLGHIRELARFSRPDIGIVTGIGPVHLQFFKNLEGVVRAKGELLASLPPEGTAVLNLDDPYYLVLRSMCACKHLTFGYEGKAMVRAMEVGLDTRGRASFVLRIKGGDGRRVRLPLPGRHNVVNALAAAAGALAAGATLEEITGGLEKARLTEWRMEMIEKAQDITIINDAYNANPASMQAALETLCELARRSRAIAVLGDMAELGTISREAHEQVGRMVVEYGTDVLITVGKKARFIAQSARATGLPRGSVFPTSSVEEAASILRAIVEPGDVVLIKGSRFLGMERLADMVA